MNDTICIPSGSNASDVIANLTAEGVLEPGQNFSRISAAEQYFLYDSFSRVQFYIFHVRSTDMLR